MKIIITESQYEMLSNSLKRRLTPEDFEWLDNEITDYIRDSFWVSDFDQFISTVIGDLIHDFVMHQKGAEIKSVEVPNYGVVYDEDDFEKTLDLYFELRPFLIEKYKDRIYRNWKVRGE